ncbi:MAG: tRNA (adenosine(37)-N6)-threonylcarbamoyltransferase complex dimerization subunit type 1 TsaB [Lachnospiraceae bacterium]|nr:tRNA (adenosine(37)-N6)-threonylcarbamoyltransferase complex dimerization subunit type 1 TsaB [Lachnospiraceae bacterium]
MKILAVEASGPVAGCAVLEDGLLVAEYSTQYKKKHSQSLIPMLDEMCRMVELDLKEIDAIAVTAGPGSFTGLRIGAATVKGLGLALDKPLIPVPTVDALASGVFGTDMLVCPLMDARRQQVYTGIYECRTKLTVLHPQCVVPLSEIAARLNELAAGTREVLFLGDGVPVSKEALGGLMEVPYHFAPAHLDRQRAAALAVRAADLWEETGEACLVSADAFRPEYLRKPQAERELGSRRNYSMVQPAGTGNV